MYPLGMYLRITERRNRDGSTVAYYALAEKAWNAAAKRAEARVVHNFGRADQVDRDGLKRLVKSINRVLDAGDAVASGLREVLEIEIERVFELGVVSRDGAAMLLSSANRPNSTSLVLVGSQVRSNLPSRLR